VKDLYGIQYPIAPLRAGAGRVSPRKYELRQRSQCEGRGFDPLPLHQSAQTLTSINADLARASRERNVRPVWPYASGSDRVAP